MAEKRRLQEETARQLALLSAPSPEPAPPPCLPTPPPSPPPAEKDEQGSDIGRESTVEYVLRAAAKDPSVAMPRDRLKKLTHLNLKRCAMGRRDRFPHLAQCLQNVPRLAELDLSGNDLGAEACNALLTSLLKNKKVRLEAICLAGNSIGGGGVGGPAVVAVRRCRFTSG